MDEILDSWPTTEQIWTNVLGRDIYFLLPNYEIKCLDG